MGIKLAEHLLPPKLGERVGFGMFHAFNAAVQGAETVDAAARCGGVGLSGGSECAKMRMLNREHFMKGEHERAAEWAAKGIEHYRKNKDNLFAGDTSVDSGSAAAGVLKKGCFWVVYPTTQRCPSAEDTSAAQDELSGSRRKRRAARAAKLRGSWRADAGAPKQE